ncbi:hypothetical protein OIU84_014568 [Salix udensis]|uniref:HEAT repeat-containing protein n=1 Tax=Salix udensis TaxID=889485 RepID=A0AAD6NRI4_9ROSI|nr:hypothetical protein OIU84_014568 [Salix udensis]
MDVERSSLCNCVVNFLLEEKYILTAFELLQELLDDGRDDHAIRLKEFFSDTSHFPPDQISRFNSLRVADPQSLLEEKEAMEEKLALTAYELRLAQEDISRLTELQKKSDLSLAELSESKSNLSVNLGPDILRQKKNASLTDLGPLKDNERRDLNCAVKEYLLLAGYRLAAMTFYEEVTDQNLDVWQNTPACVPDALRHYYYQYLSSTSEAAEEKIAMLRENESLLKANERLNNEKEKLLIAKDLSNNQINGLTKSLEAVQKDIKDRESQIQELKQSWERQRKEINDCRSEITSLKMHIEGSRSGMNMVASDVDDVQSQSLEKYKEEIKSLQMEIVGLKAKGAYASESIDNSTSEKESHQAEEKVVEIDEDKTIVSHPVDVVGVLGNGDVLPLVLVTKQNGQAPSEDGRLQLESDNLGDKAASENMGLRTIEILADALPKIVPYVLINHREELLPLMMCAIECHPDSGVRDSLTHTLFNLIKRPDEQQRRIIMDACVRLAKNVGQMRTETELLPQCWEQINHMYEEQDSAIVVREAAAHNLSLLLPLFPNVEKYFKVEELMFHLVCDPSGVVVDTALKELLPAVIKWGNRLEHILRVLLSHILSSAQHCPPLSGVEGSMESHLRVLGERELWNIDVLLRMLVELLSSVHQKAVETCPLSSALESKDMMFSTSLLETNAREHAEWQAFDWMHVDCFPDLIQLACMLPQKEDNLRIRTTKFLLAVSEYFGDSYLVHIMLPLFLVSVGDNADLSFFPSVNHPRIKGLRPRTAVAERIATMCVLPLLLAGVLGAPSQHEQLANYLRGLLVDGTLKESQSTKHTAEIIDAVRFLCTFEKHHSIIFNILWEMVVSSNIDMKINAANLLKAIMPYIDAKVASTHVLPALITLGSDPNLNVKYASIEAFGAVAQHFKNDMIVDKIRVQMDAFLEDGSHEATIAVFTASQASVSDVMRRRERANAFCESIRALDATDLSANSVKEFLLPAIQNLLRDPDALDPAHKEALEIIMKERSGGTLEALSKAMGAHLGLASSVSSFFGDSGLLGKKEASEPVSPQPDSPMAVPPLQAEDTRFRRIMRGNFSEMLRGKTKGIDETNPSQ